MRTLTILFVILPCLPVSARANLLLRMEIPSSPNPVGNPGGVNQLDFPKMSVVCSYMGRSEDNTFGGHPEASGDSSVDAHNLNQVLLTFRRIAYDSGRLRERAENASLSDNISESEPFSES